MKKRFSVRTIILAGSLLLQLNTLCFQSRGAAGDVDLSFDPGFGVNGQVNAVVMQPDGKVLIAGQFTTVKGLVRVNVARLNADGSGDPTFNPDTAYDVVSALALQSDGKVLVGSGGIFRLNSDGSQDTNFMASLDVVCGQNCTRDVHSIAVQPDGKMLVGGLFSTLNGTNNSTGIARLNANGSLDGSFNPGTGANGRVSSVALQSDGKVLIGGGFNMVNGTNRYGIVRLNADGSLDSSFNPDAGVAAYALGVCSIVVQSDGKVLIGGDFQSVNGTNYGGIARLNANGSLDGSFNPGTGVFGYPFGVWSIVVQSDGKVLIGGNFYSVNGTNRNGIARLNANGSLDSSFNAGRDIPYYYVYGVSSVVMQSDGKVLIGGLFTTINGTNRSRIARLNADGGLDSSFQPGIGVNGPVSSIAVQPDGKVLIGGPFTFIYGTNRYGSARLNADGSVDNTFVSSSFYPVLGASVAAAVAVQSDGKMIVGGARHEVCAVGEEGCQDIFGTFVTRLNPDGSPDTSFTEFDHQFELSPAYTETVQSVALQPDGKIVVSYGGPEGYGDPTGYGRLGLVRLNANGSRDTNFNTSIGQFSGSVVASVAPQADGKLLIGGSFNITINGTNRYGLARLNSNGSVDTTFNPAVGGYPIALQPDGKVLVGGYARLNADGSLDSSFNSGTGANGFVRSIALQPDGKVIIGGDFSSVNGVPRPHVARLYGDSVAPSLSIARSNAFVIVSWPSPSTGFVLQQNTNLNTTNWTTPSEPVTDNGTTRFITVSPTVGNRFYRLFKS